MDVVEFCKSVVERARRRRDYLPLYRESGREREKDPLYRESNKGPYQACACGLKAFSGLSRLPSLADTKRNDRRFQACKEV